MKASNNKNYIFRVHPPSHPPESVEVKQQQNEEQEDNLYSQ